MAPRPLFPSSTTARDWCIVLAVAVMCRGEGALKTSPSVTSVYVDSIPRVFGPVASPSCGECARGVRMGSHWTWGAGQTWTIARRRFSSAALAHLAVLDRLRARFSVRVARSSLLHPSHRVGPLGFESGRHWVCPRWSTAGAGRRRLRRASGMASDYGPLIIVWAVHIRKPSVPFR